MTQNKKKYKSIAEIIKNTGSGLNRLYQDTVETSRTTKLIRHYLPTEFGRYCTIARVKGDTLSIRFSDSHINSKFRFYATEVAAEICKFPEFTHIKKLKHGYVSKKSVGLDSRLRGNDAQGENNTHTSSSPRRRGSSKNTAPNLSAIINSMLKNLEEDKK